MKEPKLEERKLSQIEASLKIPKRKKSKDDWRSLFALIILSGYFAVIGIIVIKMTIFSDCSNMIELLSTVGSLVGTPLGFVIGYYYKNK